MELNVIDWKMQFPNDATRERDAGFVMSLMNNELALGARLECIIPKFTGWFSARKLTGYQAFVVDYMERIVRSDVMPSPMLAVANAVAKLIYNPQ